MVANSAPRFASSLSSSPVSGYGRGPFVEGGAGLSGSLCSAGRGLALRQAQVSHHLARAAERRQLASVEAHRDAAGVADRQREGARRGPAARLARLQENAALRLVV